MMTDEHESFYNAGDNYDNAIVAIAIGDDVGTEMNANADESDGSFDDFIAGVSAAIDVDDEDIDREETWLRKCAGDLPTAVETNSNDFAVLPPEVQMRIVLDLREKEKSTLLKSLRESSSLIERLKKQLYESEDKRIELEHELDTENTQVREMEREFREMKKAHKRRIRDVERIANEMNIQRERLSMIIEQQTSISSVATTVPSSSEHAKISPEKSEIGDSLTENAQEENMTLTPGTRKSEIERAFEHRLQADPEYREEFERFKEFQAYYQLQRKSENDSIISRDDEYGKMLEFQLAYERILSFVQKKRKHI